MCPKTKTVLGIGRTNAFALRARKTATVFLLTFALALPALGDQDMAPPELPFWPIAMYAPPSFRQLYAPTVKRAATTSDARPRADILVWMPPDTRRIRAVLLVVNNAQSKLFGEHPALRETAKKHGMGVIYLRQDRPRPPMKRDPAKGTYVWDESADAAFRCDIPRPAWWLTPHEDLGDAQLVMDYVAQKTGVPEFKHAPWITYGQSSRGKFPFHMAWKFPKRTVATIDHHAETPTWPPDDWATFDGQTVMHANLNGEVEWGGTFAVHVRPSLLNFRNKTSWLPHQAVARGIAHTDYDNSGKDTDGKATQVEVWDYLAVHVDKALSLRLPKEGFPTEGPLKLNNIDPATGYLIETFAIEDILGRPRLPLVEKDGLFVVNPKEPTVNGYARIPPAAGYVPPEGVPVVPIAPGRSPTDWLLTEGMPFAVKVDPMVDVGAFAALRPKPGDAVEIDGRKTAFSRIKDAQVGRRDGPRGISTSALKQRGVQKLTLLGYTVLDVKEPGAYSVTGLHSLAVRLRLVLNGVPVDHRQVVQLDKGLYPMLFVLRMDGVIWPHCEPSLDTASEEQIVEAKTMQADKEKALAEFEARRIKKRDPMSFVHKYTDVPEFERYRMLWVADKEQATAWVRLHTPKSPGKKD